MASFADEEQIASDEAFARRLQEEEFFSGNGNILRYGMLRNSSASNPNVRSPILIGAAAQGGPVQQNLAQEVSDAQISSPRVLLIQCILWIMELVASIVILSRYWDKQCDKPLQTWLLVFSSRLLVMVPIRLFYFIRRRNVIDGDPAAVLEIPPKVIQVEKLVRLATFIWFIVGQAWVYSSNTCRDTAPGLYIYSLVLVIVVYISLALPIIMLLGLCICLPCVILLLRAMQVSPGASDEDIEKLPVQRFTRAHRQNSDSESADDGSSKSTCVICMNDFEEGDEMRVLPCKHQFHKGCVDNWLKVKRQCPLCRGDIGTRPAAAVEDAV